VEHEKHLEQLKRKHFELEEKINFEQKKLSYSESEIKMFKKKKLHIKDKIKKVAERVVYN
jgi:hypothetical protein